MNLSVLKAYLCFNTVVSPLESLLVTDPCTCYYNYPWNKPPPVIKNHFYIDSLFTFTLFKEDSFFTEWSLNYIFIEILEVSTLVILEKSYTAKQALDRQ